MAINCATDEAMANLETRRTFDRSSVWTALFLHTEKRVSLSSLSFGGVFLLLIGIDFKTVLRANRKVQHPALHRLALAGY